MRSNTVIHARLFNEDAVTGIIKQGDIGDVLPYNIVHLQVGDHETTLFLSPEQTEKLVAGLSDSLMQLKVTQSMDIYSQLELVHESNEAIGRELAHA